MKAWLKDNVIGVIAVAMIGGVVSTQFTVADRVASLETLVLTVVERGDKQYEIDRVEFIRRLERLEAMHLEREHDG